MNNDYKFRFAKDMCSLGLSLFIFNPETREAVDFLHTTRVPAGENIPKALDISGAQAQQMIDSLWDVGVRPSEGTGSAGSLKATEKHLEDMRKIAFQQLDKEGK